MFDNLLEVLIDNIPYSVWLRDIYGKFIFANQYYANTLNLKKEEIVGKTLYELYPNELAKEYEGNYNEVIIDNKPRLFSGYTEDVFLECYIAPIKKDGKIEMFLGILQNKTSRKKYEEELIRQKDLLETLINTIPDCVFHKDIDGKYIDCNVAFAKEYYGKDKKDVIGKSDNEILGSSNLDSEMISTIVEQDKQVINTKLKKSKTFRIARNQSSIKYMESIKAPILNSNGDVSGIVGVARDVTNTVILEEKLKKMSYKDKLTDLYNRAYFDEKIKKFNHKKYLPMNLIMGDVNGLKLVNDTIGHLKGDELLVDISKVIKKSCREQDFIFRWGGDEICILLPNTTEIEAERICQRIKYNCKNTPNDTIPLSIALGTSSKSTCDKSIDDVLKEAEDRVYRDKLLSSRAGRGFMINSLQESLAQKHPQTEEHTTRVVEYAKRLGARLSLSNDQLNELILLAKLHDIGKIGIPDEILLRAGRLNEEEFEIMKTHAEKGYRIAKSNPEIEPVARGILAHHERYDGTGYPLGLKGDDIPFLARIICVVDSYDAMTSNRSYKSNISKESAINELKQCSGKQFDPEIVKVFLEEIEND